jgi:hypothetical protein
MQAKRHGRYLYRDCSAGHDQHCSRKPTGSAMRRERFGVQQLVMQSASDGSRHSDMPSRSQDEHSRVLAAFQEGSGCRDVRIYRDVGPQPFAPGAHQKCPRVFHSPSNSQICLSEEPALLRVPLPIRPPLNLASLATKCPELSLLLLKPCHTFPNAPRCTFELRMQQTAPCQN